MQKFKAEDGASLDGTAVDRDGFKAGTRYLAKVINDNQWNVFEVVETAGYTLIDDDLSQLAKAVKSPYNQSYTYNTSAIATQTVSDVVLGSDGAYYEVLNDGVSNDDPVTNLNGNWKKIPFKVSPAVNDDEAINKGQLLGAIKEVDGSGSGLDADLVRGLPADFTSSLATNGYQKLPSGLIMQWGLLENANLDQSWNAVSFPIAFPNNALNVTASISATGAIGGTRAILIDTDIRATGFDVTGDYDTDTSTGNIFWFAVGY